MLVCANCNNVIPSGCQDVAIQLLWVLAGGYQGVVSRIHVVYRVLLLYSVAVVSLMLHSLNSIYKGVAIQLLWCSWWFSGCCYTVTVLLVVRVMFDKGTAIQLM